jgi:hypothetical protein
MDGDVACWPVTSLAVVQQFGRDRVESGHRADIVDRSKMTPSGPGEQIKRTLWLAPLLLLDFVEMPR